MSEKVSLRELVAAERQQMGSAGSPSEVPVVSVPLPSRGKVYAADSVLFMADSLDVRAMTAKDENLLSSPALLKKGQALSSVLKACITNVLVDPDSMLIGDRNAVLIAIRNSSYGHEYAVEVPCPACDAVIDHTFDMSRLPMVILEADPVTPNTNAFRYVLPRSKREVIFKLMTGRDVAELNRTQAQLKKNSLNVDNTVTLELHSQIISIAGEDDRTKLMRLVETMEAFDSMSLRDYIQDINPGIDMVQEMTCPSCDAVSEVDVPLGTEFFWPSRRRRRRR